ncbi:MAG: hypothetical protein EA379_02900 [Phycisphaerales bacterium]|nr:MAG: hypothetical protein EA379_02900 [Phycisphaerales bacterium]
MAKGQHYSRAQKGIINRYYEHKDTILAQRLCEIASDLALADTDAKRERLWKRAETAIKGAKVEPKTAAKVLSSRNIEELARLAATLSA